MIDALAQSLNDVVAAVGRHAGELAAITIASVVAFVATRHYIPMVAATLFERNIYGIDINKTTAAERQAFAEERRRGAVNSKSFKKKAVPESLGIVVGAVYLSVVVVLVLLIRLDISALSGSLTTITVMLLLGFVDDVLDVRWRYKLFLSAVGSLPLIMAYDGSFSVLIPPTLTRYLDVPLASVTSQKLTSPSSEAVVGGGYSLRWLSEHGILQNGADRALMMYLGPLYLVYLSLLCIFCTNSINILAGVNGVEVGQSLVIAVASVVYNVLQLRLPEEAAGVAANRQVRALALLGPFIGVSAALWRFNRYPARVFVGDSYTYFAGTVLAVAAVTGVYSKTLMLFFVPQLINFVLSLPQLFGLVACPRHRVPTWNPSRDVLENSFNYTLLNLILWVCGPMSEWRLTRVVMQFQALTCALGFVVRYLFAWWMYDRVQ